MSNPFDPFVRTIENLYTAVFEKEQPRSNRLSQTVVIAQEDVELTEGYGSYVPRSPGRAYADLDLTGALGNISGDVVIEEATTNLFVNPNAGVDTSTMSTQANNTLSRSDEQSIFGDYSFKAVQGTGGTWMFAVVSSVPTIVNGTTYTCSVYLYIPTDWDGGTIAFRIEGAGGVLLSGASGTLTVNADMGLRDQWQRLVCTFTPGATVTWFPTIRPTSAATTGRALYCGAWQHEQKGYATTYCDGAQGDGYAWSGTAHASSSSRTITTLTYPRFIMGDVNENYQTLWVAARFETLRDTGDFLSQYPVVVELRDASGNERIMLYYDQSAQTFAFGRRAGGTYGIATDATTIALAAGDTVQVVGSSSTTECRVKPAGGAYATNSNSLNPAPDGAVRFGAIEGVDSSIWDMNLADGWIAFGVGTALDEDDMDALLALNGSVDADDFPSSLVFLWTGRESGGKLAHANLFPVGECGSAA